MANFLLPQSPLMRGEDYVYPLTKAEQVVLADGTRLDKGGEIYADRLGGVSAENYALKTDLGITMTLLWENPDPSAEFEAQTVAVDLSSYQLIMIMFSAYDGTCQSTSIVTVGADGSLYTVYDPTFGMCIRYFQSSSSGITFDSGDHEGDTDDSASVPYRIYGIGGVKNG